MTPPFRRLAVLGLVAATAGPACADHRLSSLSRGGEPPGDPVAGRQLVAELECNRCHEGTDTLAPPNEKQCFGCHQRIIAGTFYAPHLDKSSWRERVAYVREAPSLENTAMRLKRGWIERFLLEPYDLRPNLAATMPRLALTKQQARDIASYLAMSEKQANDLGVFLGEVDVDDRDLDRADLESGRELLDAKGCGSCHTFSGVPPLAHQAATTAGFVAEPAVTLAPDLRHTRDRMRAATVVTWIKHPQGLKRDTHMPEISMSDDAIRDIAAYILHTPLAPVEPRPIPVRLPLLTRPVGYDEVSEKVLRRTCWHCHAEPDYAIGDGGPGNTGGFGFKPRGLDVAEYEGIRSGVLDDDGERRSVFEPMSGGTSRLVRALLARELEESGMIDPEIRGMPLGFPALSPEDIQLVESWIAQGEPR